MEVESLHCRVTKFKTEKAALATKSSLFQSFAAMTSSFLRLPTSSEGESLKNTLQKTLVFSIELAEAELGTLVLRNSKGAVTDSILISGDGSQDLRSPLMDQILDQRLTGWVCCHHQIGLITDTVDDDRWQSRPLLPHTIRSVLAVPILKRQELLGILTLTHSKPQHFSLELAEQMRAASDHIALSIENARFYAKLEASYRTLDRLKKELEDYSKALSDELEKGRRFQKFFLPDNIPRLPDWDIATYFAPAKQVSGDFYDVFSLPGNYLGIVIADVCDKGVGSALYMALIRSLIRVFSGHISLHGFSNFAIDNTITNTVAAQAASDNQTNALNAVKLTNDYIVHEHGKECIFATLFFGVINPLTGTLAYINGGHEPLFIVNSAGVKKRLEPTGPAVGVMLAVQFDIRQVQMQSGDILIGFTDGVIEASTPDGDFFTRKRLLSILKQPPSSVSELVECVKAKIYAHNQNSPLSDDVTMLAVQRLSLKNKAAEQAA
jgi:sigma-B regulation protein RsbU (phosphoserine phosphatase)